MNIVAVLLVTAAIFLWGVPVLGICYGMQTMAAQLGGQVESSDNKEFGYAEVEVHGHSELLNNIEDFELDWFVQEERFRRGEEEQDASIHRHEEHHQGKIDRR